MNDPKPLNLICPRCAGFIPNNDRPGAYPGAMSRYTEDGIIEVCSNCGQEEAVLQMRDMAYGADWKKVVHPTRGERRWVDPPT